MRFPVVLNRHRSAVQFFTLFIAIFSFNLTLDQTYPTRPVKIIAGAAPGNTVDVVNRIVGEHLAIRLGQPVVVLNRSGAGGLLATREAVAAEPDGHTLYMAAASALTVLAFTQPKQSFDVTKDLAPIGLVADLPLVIAADPSLPVSTLGELVALAKSRPGEITYAGNVAGTVPHMTGVRLAEAAGVNLTFVPYQAGTAQAVNDVSTGRVSFIIESVPGIAGALQAGTVKPLATFSEWRLPNWPDLPTAMETIPRMTVSGWMALLGPKDTPIAILEIVQKALQRALNDGEVGRKLQAGSSYVRPGAPIDLSDLIRAEQKAWEPVIRRLTRRSSTSQPN